MSSSEYGEDKASIRTPLQWAALASEHSVMLCACLLDAHASVALVGADPDKFTPLHHAAHEGIALVP